MTGVPAPGSPGAAVPVAADEGGALLKVRDLRVHFEVEPRWWARPHRRVIKAVDGVSFELGLGEVLGIVGQSGSGKSTLALALAMVLRPVDGDFEISGRSWRQAGRRQRHALSRAVKMVFQDPYSSLNPRMTVYQTLEETLVINRFCHKTERAETVAAVLRKVALSHEEFAGLYPHQLSGGQCQRVSIARAIATEPKLLLADEPVSMLDVSVRAGILRLLRSLVQDCRRSVMLISHDIATLRGVCDRIAVMYRGRIVEEGPTDAVIRRPWHPYTQALIRAVPTRAGRVRRQPLALPAGDPMDRGLPETGCRYRLQCPHGADACRIDDPALRPFPGNRSVACHRADEFVATPP